MDHGFSRRHFLAGSALSAELAAAAQLRSSEAGAAAPGAALLDSVPVRAFGARGDGINDDSAAIQAAIDHAVLSGIGRVNFGPGQFVMRSTVRLARRGVTIVGVESANRQQGSTPRSSYLIWGGGAAPMFTCFTSLVTMRGFGVENQGRASDFLELNEGSINFVFDELSFIATETHRPFARSVIRSNGNRCGYSLFKRIHAKSPAPAFLDIAGQGPSSGITNLVFDERCIFESTAGPLTVIRLVGEVIENLTIRDCTFNANNVTGRGGELLIVDTTTSPLPDAIRNLTFANCEIDAVGRMETGWRSFRLAQVRNLAFDGNVMNFGGTPSAMASLAGSNVTSCEGNYWKSLNGPLFELDSACSVTCGSNWPQRGSTHGIFTVASAGIEQLEFGPSVAIELKHGNSRPHLFMLDVTGAAPYRIAIATLPPAYKPAPGATFALTIRNLTSAAVAAPVFDPRLFRTQGADQAPAPGSSRSYSFYWDGVKATEISRTGGDVPNV